MQYLPELLGDSKTLTLSNGEHLLMNGANFKLIFETGSLENASPASLLNSVSWGPNQKFRTRSSLPEMYANPQDSPEATKVYVF